jgi:hypothetical protein
LWSGYLFNNFYIKNEKIVIAKYGSMFSPQNLQNLTADDFISFLLFKNNKHWSGLQRLGRKIVLDMDKLRSTLKEILDESKPIKDRFDTIFRSGKPIIEGLWRAILTPILLVVYPERYSVYNGITETAMRHLGIHPDFTANETLGERYAAINEIIKNIAIKNNISLWEMDWIWWNIVRGISDTDSEALAKEPNTGESYFLHQTIAATSLV